MPTSVEGDLDFQPRKQCLLSREFSAFLNKLGTLLEECTDVDALKLFLGYYAHPLYPNKLYVERHVYRNAHSVRGVLFSCTLRTSTT